MSASTPQPLYLSSAPRKVQFRVWDSHLKTMCYPWTDKVANPLAAYPTTGFMRSFLLSQEGRLSITDGIRYYQAQPALEDGEGALVLLMDTGLRTAEESPCPIYEGDIVSFTVRGATHGREPDHCRAAHVWWHPDDACWAFGQWVQPREMWDGKRWVTKGTFSWWYTAMEDGFDHSTLKVLGNLFQHPELVASLGYTPHL